MILALIIGIVSFFVFYLWVYADTDDGLAAFGIALMAALIIGLIGALLAGLFSALSDPYEVETKTPLVLVSDGTAVNGRFALFSGLIETGEVFRYYIKDTNGGMTLHSKSADKSTIYEDSAKPYMTTICLEKEDAWYKINGPDGPYDCRYEFHVPENSVSREIVLDGN
jgi:hypothetical protein